MAPPEHLHWLNTVIVKGTVNINSKLAAGWTIIDPPTNGMKVDAPDEIGTTIEGQRVNTKKGKRRRIGQ